MNVWHDDVPVHEAPSSLTPEILVGLFRLLDAADEDGGWRRREVGGTPLLMQTHDPYYPFHEVGESNPKPRLRDALTDVQRMAVKMALNTNYGNFGLPRTIARGVDIMADDDSWLIAFNMAPPDVISEMYPHIIGVSQQPKPEPKYWDGAGWVRVHYVEVRGDYDRFIHDMTKVILFESEWMPLPPDENKLYRYLSVGSQIYDPTLAASITKSGMQAIGRALRYPSSVVVAINNANDKIADRKMRLKIIKSRNT